MEKPIVVERYADNGEHSHYDLVDSEGNILWSEFIADENSVLNEMIMVKRGIETGNDMVMRISDGKLFVVSKNTQKDMSGAIKVTATLKDGFL